MSLRCAMSEEAIGFYQILYQNLVTERSQFEKKYEFYRFVKTAIAHKISPRLLVVPMRSLSGVEVKAGTYHNYYLATELNMLRNITTPTIREPSIHLLI